MRYTGPFSHLLKSEFKRMNRAIDWEEGYNCVEVEIKEIPIGGTNE